MPKHAPYHSKGEMIPFELKRTRDDQEECFILTLNHREYPLHTTEVLALQRALQVGLIEWLNDYPAELMMSNPVFLTDPHWVEFITMNMDTGAAAQAGE